MNNSVDIDIRTYLQGTNTPLNLGNYVTNLIGAILTVAAIATFGYLIFGGTTWITAGGDEKNIEKARSRITNAIIGLAIVAVSWALFLIINHVFGIGIIGGSSGSNSSAGYVGGESSSQGVCLYPTSRCCDDVNNSACFCQNPSYTTATHGACNAGGGHTGILCDCVPKKK